MTNEERALLKAYGVWLSHPDRAMRLRDVLNSAHKAKLTGDAVSSPEATEAVAKVVRQYWCSWYFGVCFISPKYPGNVGAVLRSAVNFGARMAVIVNGRYRREPADTLNASDKLPIIRLENIASLLAWLPNEMRLVSAELTPNARPAELVRSSRRCPVCRGGAGRWKYSTGGTGMWRHRADTGTPMSQCGRGSKHHHL